MILTLEGLSHGMLEDQARRQRGIGADIVIRASTATFLSLGEAFPDKLVPFVRRQPHVVLATGALMRPTGPLTTVTGLKLSEFERMSGSFRFLSGRPYLQPGEVIIDEYYAREHRLRTGDTMTMLNSKWRVSGVFEQGKLARLIVSLDRLQDLTENTGKINVIYVKLDNPAYTDEVIESLRTNGMGNFKINSMEEIQSLYAVKNVPMLPEFTDVVIGLGVVVGFLVVFLSMYTAVLERTREIGVLKALGASPGFVLNVLVRETALLAVLGSVLGIVFTYGTRWLIMTFWPGSLIQAIVPEWWPIAAGIAIAGALLGAAWPGLKAARQDAIEALSYE